MELTDVNYFSSLDANPKIISRTFLSYSVSLCRLTNSNRLEKSNSHILLYFSPYIHPDICYGMVYFFESFLFLKSGEILYFSTGCHCNHPYSDVVFCNVARHGKN